jgi:hypothetical protein
MRRSGGYWINALKDHMETSILTSYITGANFTLPSNAELKRKIRWQKNLPVFFPHGL